MFDLKIAGGTIVDGTGKPGYAADIAIKDGKVAAIGANLASARETVEAQGRIVAPGFVDIHTHYDAQVFWDHRLSISPWHGVTTCIIGNCGFGVAPTRPEHRRMILRTLEKVEGMSLSALESGLGTAWPFVTFPEYMDTLTRRGTAINVGVFAGHTPIRLYVMGEDAMKREATADELKAMERLVEESMEAGAIGFGTSQAVTHNAYDGLPVPSRKASFDEIKTLVAAMARSGRGVMQATIGPTLYLKEFGAIAEATGCAITWTALFSGLMGPGSHLTQLARAHDQQRRGLRITPQITCRPLNFDFDFMEPFPFEAREFFAPTMKTDKAGKMAIYRDPAFRATFKEDLKPGVRNAFAAWYDRTVISLAPGAPELEERSLAEVAAEAGVDPVDFALDLALATDLGARFRFAAVNYDEAEVGELLDADGVVVALSDAGAHASQLCDACYSTYLLGHWVRERKRFTIERAVEMLTRIPADVFGLSDRGRIALGLPADLVVFDPKTVGAGPLKRVHDLPTGADRLIAEALGIDAVICNGTIIRKNGADVGEGRPGHVLRGA